MMNFRNHNKIVNIKIFNNAQLSTTDFSNAFNGMTNLVKCEIPYKKLTNMHYTYYNCYNLTGSPVCGPNVTSMYSTYYNCSNLTGSPVCGPNVTDMSSAYENCYNLTGSAVCGDNVNRMYYTYYNCRNLTTAVCGNKVTDMSYAYRNCGNITNALFYSNNVVNVYSCFYGRNTSNILDIYVHNGSTTLNTCLSNNYTSSLVGLNITWTNNGTCHYNKQYNIYIYPVDGDIDTAKVDKQIERLIDFEYTENDDGTYTITDWKGTLNGESSTECIIPEHKLIKVQF